MINLLSCSPFHFLLLPQHNFSKSYHKQSAIIPILIWMCWIFSFFWRFIAILMSLIFWLLELCQSVWSISFCHLQWHLIKQTRVIILRVIFSISNVQRYMFRLMAQEFEHILCNYIEISFYLLLLLAKMKILLNKEGKEDFHLKQLNMMIQHLNILGPFPVFKCYLNELKFSYF